MPRLPSIGSFCWKLCCGGVSCLNLLFAGAALLQSGIILFNAMGRSVPLPNAIPALITAKILPEDLSLKWTKAYFDLGGGCLLQGVEIHHQSGEQLFSADVVRLNLALPQLVLRSGPPLEELEATVASLHIPAPISASGANEPLLVLHEARLSIKGSRILLHRVMAQSGEASVVLQGSLPASLLHPSGQEASSPIMPHLARLEAFLRQLDQIHALADLSGGDGPDDPLRIELFASGQHRGLPATGELGYVIRGKLDLPAQGEIRLRDLEGRLSLATPPPLPAAVVSLVGPFQTPVQGRLRTLRDPRSNGDSSLALRFTEPFGPAGRISALELVAEASLSAQAIQWRARAADMKASGEALLQTEGPEPALAALSGWVSLENPVLRQWIPALPEHPLLDATTAASMETRFSWDASDRTTRGSSSLKGLRFDHERIAYVAINWTADPDKLTLDPFSIDLSADQAISGSFEMAFDSRAFSLSTAGHLYPHSLDRFLGDWWKAIFQNIRVAEPVEAEVAITGLLGVPASLRSVVHAASRSASYRDVPIPDLRLRVRGNKDWAFMESLRASFGDSFISGQLAWQQGLGDAVRRPMLLNFQSNAPWPVVLKASGIRGLEALDFSAPPLLSINGWIFRPPRANRSLGPVSALDVDLRMPDGDMRFRGLEFRQILCTASVRGPVIEVQPLSGSFAGGIFTGSLLMRPFANPDAQTSDLRLQLIDADFTDSMEQLSRLLKDPRAFMANFSKSGSGGRLNGNFTLHLAHDPADWTSAGQLSIKGARLGQIHLLGGLSKILNAIGLGFTSLDIHSGNLEWSLADNTLHIPKSLFTGTLLGLRLEGSVFLPANDLDMRADLNLFQGIVSKVLTPVSDNIQLDLRGTLNEPRWSVRLSPLRWFTNRLTEGLASPP